MGYWREKSAEVIASVVRREMQAVEDSPSTLSPRNAPREDSPSTLSPRNAPRGESPWSLSQFDVDLKKLTDQQKQQLKCAIDAAYPFVTKKNYPYQVWLDERRKAFVRLGLKNEKLRQKGDIPSYTNVRDSTVPGQQSLF